MNKSIRLILDSGVKSEFEEDIKERIRLLNGISLLGIPICVFYVVTFAMTGFHALALLMSAGVPMFIFPILGNKWFGLRFTRVFSSTVTPIFFAIATIAMGREVGFYLGYLIITVPPLLFFDSARKAWPYVGFSIFCFGLAMLGLLLLEPLSVIPFPMPLFLVNLITVLSVTLVVITFFRIELDQNKAVLREKNREILDSINYASRIQTAILPPARIVKEHLPNSFVLYKPKDVVAGDFYWLEEKEGLTLFAAADCTGHGVPGAMVSVICNNALNRSVREFALDDPGKILDKTRELVIQEFEKSDEEVKDGMDIALCSLKGMELKYAGAHNPLWIIRNGEVLETKANKQPIGQFDQLQPYQTHIFQLQKGDTIYVFSDGYVDQFGGENGKKFKAKALRELLLGMQDKPIENQKELIDQTFENWRGDIEQIDDVVMIGVKI